MVYPIGTALKITKQLRKAKVWYSLSTGNGALNIYAVTPGRRWEIEISVEGDPTVREYTTSGGMSREEMAPELIEDLNLRSPLLSLSSFLDELVKRDVKYALSDHTGEAIMVETSSPGKRWEVEFFADGEVRIEKFVNETGTLGREALTAFLRRIRD